MVKPGTMVNLMGWTLHSVLHFTLQFDSPPLHIAMENTDLQTFPRSGTALHLLQSLLCFLIFLLLLFPPSFLFFSLLLLCFLDPLLFLLLLFLLLPFSLPLCLSFLQNT